MKDALFLAAFGAGFLAAILRVLYSHGFRIVCFWLPPDEIDQLISECRP
jgi:hypothetical protein